MKQFNVDLGERSYPIFIGGGILDQSEYFSPYLSSRQVMVVSNETVAPLYLDRLQASLAGTISETVILPDGESHKNLDVLNQIYDALLQNRYGRGATLVALGGGVIGDMTGFAAATYQRGVSFIQVPTTLLSQVDSSVGGKTGVNHALGKNMIGAFYQPKCVVIDPRVLVTLPDRELSAGLAEVIKYGAISDTQFFDWLELNMAALMARDEEALIEAIEQSCQNKARVVAQDEYESGLRAILNFGHTFGHAIETGMGYGAWLHGEAVGAGMCMAAHVSRCLGLLAMSDVGRIIRLCEKGALPTSPPNNMSADRFLELMMVDKKNRDGRLTLILLESIGKAVIRNDVDMGQLKSAIETYDVKNYLDVTAEIS